MNTKIEKRPNRTRAFDRRAKRPAVIRPRGRTFDLGGSLTLTVDSVSRLVCYVRNSKHVDSIKRHCAARTLTLSVSIVQYDIPAHRHDEYDIPNSIAIEISGETSELATIAQHSLILYYHYDLSGRAPLQGTGAGIDNTRERQRAAHRADVKARIALNEFADTREELKTAQLERTFRESNDEYAELIKARQSGTITARGAEKLAALEKLADKLFGPMIEMD